MVYMWGRGGGLWYICGVMYAFDLSFFSSSKNKYVFVLKY